MPRRSRAREAAFQVLYQDDLNPRNDPTVGDDFLMRRLKKGDLIEFARKLVAGVRGVRPEVDALIEKAAANWSLARMTTTDRNVLRLGAYELLHTDTPDIVTIDEAINLAKRFGTSESAQFVNGVLDKLMHGARGSESPVANQQATADESDTACEPTTPGTPTTSGESAIAKETAASKQAAENRQGLRSRVRAYRSDSGGNKPPAANP